MSESIAVSGEASFPLPQAQGGWRAWINWTAAILIAAVFLVAGLWKVTNPAEAAVRLAQARVPQSLSIVTAVVLGILETFAGMLLLIPRFRRWGSWIGTFLLAVFMLFIAVHYNELRGVDCSCFPWIKRAVGPGFFIGDGAMMLLALCAGIWTRSPKNVRSVCALLAAISIFALASYGYTSLRQPGVRAPETILGEDGHAISLSQGKVFVFFFNPQCLHCLEAGRKLAALNWSDTRFVGVPTENPQFGDWFMGKAGLTGIGPVSKNLAILKKTFPFDAPPAGVAIENGFEKTILLQFEDREPAATLLKIGFIH